MPETTGPPPALCPRCQAVMGATTVKTAIWRGDRMAVVEDIPARVCGSCMEQFYDEDVADALRRLSEEGFPSEKAERVMVVPVFSLKGRITPRAVLPEDTYVD